MRIKQTFAKLRDQRQAGLIAYLMAGDPDLTVTEQLVEGLVHAGVDLVELGVPFSDPVADGAVIQRAGQRALQNGTNLERILESVRRLRERGMTVPLLLMTYYNPIFHRGLRKAAESIARAGVDGLIVPDLPFEESEELNQLLGEKGLSLVHLLAPTSGEQRIKMVTEKAKGFIYCVSLTGVTGERTTLPNELPQFIQKVKAQTDQPLAVGFGLSKAEQMPLIASIADAAVVGSAFVSLVEQHPADPVTPVVGLAQTLKEALVRGPLKAIGI
jgi:tryptophan synthase alpha chain